MALKFEDAPVPVATRIDNPLTDLVSEMVARYRKGDATAKSVRVSDEQAVELQRFWREAVKAAPDTHDVSPRTNKSAPKDGTVLLSIWVAEKIVRPRKDNGDVPETDD